MKNAIILHGSTDKEEYYSDKHSSLSNSHWIPWLQNQLLINDIETSTPEMFHSFNPIYENWKKEFERYDITEETILVGHSCGGGFLLRWMSENKGVNVDKIILVAPWLDPSNELKNNFFDFTLDSDLLLKVNKLLIFHSTNDEKEMQDSLEIIKKRISDINIKYFENYGHFTLSSMETEEFPELLDEVLN